MSENLILVRVVAPHFVAGLVIENDRCIQTAPILSWAIGQMADDLRRYFEAKGWKASIIPRHCAVTDGKENPVSRVGSETG